MNCPKCGEQNADDAVMCAKCGATLHPGAVGPDEPRLISGKAIAAFVLALVALALLCVLVWSPPAVDRMLGGVEGIWVIWIAALPALLAIIWSRAARWDIRDSGGLVSGAGWARAGSLVAMIGLTLIILLVAWQSFVDSMTPGAVRGKASRARTDTRSLSLAIEAYYVDHNTYPPWGIANRGPGGTQTYNYWICSSAKISPSRFNYYIERRKIGRLVWYDPIQDPNDHPADLPCFISGPLPGQRLATLTTPAAYVTTFPHDPFALASGATFVYWSVCPGQPDPAGRIVGKDSPVSGIGWILVSPGPDLKYDMAGEWDVYNPAISQPSYRLLSGTNKKGRALRMTRQTA